jgi:hypothetical protein
MTDDRAMHLFGDIGKADFPIKSDEGKPRSSASSTIAGGIW